ncbi:MAG: hypothetical protein FJW37_11640, partial [Acidobacteria bacterium]|nr:hypothetical protein [Acidobacteriota bacterium]
MAPRPASELRPRRRASSPAIPESGPPSAGTPPGCSPIPTLPELEPGGRMRRRNLCSRILSRLLVALALPAFAGETRITLLATTDLHGHIYPVDYYTAKPAERGLAKIATLIRQARAENPNTLLIDCGDTIQGSPLEYVWQTHLLRGRPPLGLGWAGPPPAGDPMMLAMSRLGYDAMAVGNHEFNFGLKNLEKARNDARFPWIAANIAGGSPGAGRPFAPYILKTVGGVKVAVVGIITPSVPSWEKPENLGSYRFLEP